MANKDFMDPELTEEEKRETILANEDDYQHMRAEESFIIRFDGPCREC